MSGVVGRDLQVESGEFGFPAGHVIQTKATYSDTKSSVSSSTTNTFSEPSTDYRVTISPKFQNSMMIVKYYIPISITATSGNANCIKLLRAFRIIGSGSKEFDVSSQGGASSSRQQIAGHGFRKLNGHDHNDQQAESFTVIDYPDTTSSLVYGFEYYQENSNPSTDYFGFSSYHTNWGYSSRVITIVQEIAV